VVQHLDSIRKGFLLDLDQSDVVERLGNHVFDALGLFHVAGSVLDVGEVFVSLLTVPPLLAALDPHPTAHGLVLVADGVLLLHFLEAGVACVDEVFPLCLAFIVVEIFQ